MDTRIRRYANALVKKVRGDPDVEALRKGSVYPYTKDLEKKAEGLGLPHAQVCEVIMYYRERLDRII